MTTAADRILERLADGAVQSGQRLAAECGISRAAIAKHVRRLRDAGWPIQARRGVGYRLERGLRPLRREGIEDALGPAASRVADLEVLAEVDSTNARLTGAAVPPGGAARICIAEHQTAGRGRRGRAWHAAVGGGITFSVARAFDASPSALLGLGLVAGVAAGETLAAHGVPDIGLKWPNDIQSGGAKVGGLLVELAGETGGPTRAVVGLGVNYDLGAAGADIGQRAADVRGTAPAPPDRSLLAGALMAALVRSFDQFERHGLAPFLDRWRPLDALVGRAVRVEAPGGAVAGTARGVAPDGALLLATPDGAERRFLSGDVSVREAT